MLRLLSDEDFNGKLFDALLRRRPSLDIVRVQDAGLRQQPDPVVLAWAAANGRIVLSQDKTTMPSHVRARLEAGEFMPGVFLVNDRATYADVIESILLLEDCSEPSEWVGQLVRLPL